MRNIAKILTIVLFLMPTFTTAETITEKNLNQIFSEKRALVKENMQLTEKESPVFWPLYDEYEKVLIYSFNRWMTLIKKYLQQRENLSDKSAKEMVDEMLEIQAEDVEVKRAYVKKFSEKLPYKRVFQYFLMEERVVAGFDSLMAEELPPIE